LLLYIQDNLGDCSGKVNKEIFKNELINLNDIIDNIENLIDSTSISCQNDKLKKKIKKIF